MRRHAVSVVAVIFLFAGLTSPASAGDAKEDATKKDLEAFKGAWKLVSREVDGKKLSDEDVKDIILTSEGAGKVTIRRGDTVRFADLEPLAAMLRACSGNELQ